MADFDPGPPPPVADHFVAVPSYAAHREMFWYDWGPVFYRGRLDRSAKVLGIASDPGPVERVAGRTLVGDAGQRVQGFLSKLGLTRNYSLLNAYAYALLPSQAMRAIPVLSEPDQQSWRNTLFSMVVGPSLQAVGAFGLQARIALEQWTDAPDVPTFAVPHPSSRDAGRLVSEWRAAVEQLRDVVTPDRRGTRRSPTTAPGSLSATTPPSPAVTCPSAYRHGSATTPPAGRGARSAGTLSSATPPT